jgi:hypothetical protein
MLLWWQGTETIPHPQDFDAWLRASAWIVGFGALLTFIRFCHRHRHQQAVQTDTPSLNINVKFSPSWDIGDCEVHERRSPGENFVAVDRIGRRPPLRRNIGTKQGPRRFLMQWGWIGATWSVSLRPELFQQRVHSALWRGSTVLFGADGVGPSQKQRSNSCYENGGTH